MDSPPTKSSKLLLLEQEDNDGVNGQEMTASPDKAKLMLKKKNTFLESSLNAVTASMDVVNKGSVKIVNLGKQGTDAI